MTGRKPLVMITGASAGIGQETARVFSAAGYPLLLIARRSELIEAMALPNMLAVAADVRDYDALASAIRQGEARFGPVDCLINNAGVSRLARLDEQDPAQWRDLVDINCLGVLNGMHAVAPGMKERRCGTIVNVSSTQAARSIRTMTSMAAPSISCMPSAKACARPCRHIASASWSSRPVLRSRRSTRPSPTRTPTISGTAAANSSTAGWMQTTSRGPCSLPTSCRRTSISRR
ncbi:NAD(P)-dependent oxidoreductase [Sinorhizobium meliloti]|uniref:Oxidoreductase, short-chain dehydrogenase/reductase family n=1 Tax=Rhizobium meliloti (strain 1021) TaxID=266834 RepID=Q92MR1_RHIME|nr:Oxidoreductase,short-chain dehydrogenase/reductase family [Sinorhizobium meliloti 2011]ASP59010.1 NAD(P)-dependent oxidoreductase [Sinorhizobium meliloti]CAC47130.1 Oxidoreductase, short-chain dehydrogenase/reductase family [Sinorhizobium meliloti 1021]PTD25063.1 SDR family NAD(P)-dependent oxidoreductase [Sinorhizobium meliloti]RVL46235.1 SDR family oxidoreductase [Sinorhizobium meliloti]